MLLRAAHKLLVDGIFKMNSNTNLAVFPEPVLLLAKVPLPSKGKGIAFT